MYINTDINECLNYNGACSHTCTNFDGSYTCSCNSGFKLENDGHNCTGIQWFICLVMFQYCFKTLTNVLWALVDAVALASTHQGAIFANALLGST